tara:strand:- start:218 stop:424 length:207 start_codon:yes stop_codon:yes gene_type:complete
VLETTRAVDIFLDYWIMYRKEEPYVPVLRSNQKDFKDGLLDFIETEIRTRRNLEGENIDEYLGIKEAK